MEMSFCSRSGRGEGKSFLLTSKFLVEKEEDDFEVNILSDIEMQECFTQLTQVFTEIIINFNSLRCLRET